MGEMVKQEHCQCHIERISEQSVTCGEKVSTTKETERKTFTGEAALIVANEEAAVMRRESQTKCEGMKIITKGIAVGLAVGTAYALGSFLNNSPASASGKAIPADAKVTGNDNIPGNGGGTV